MNHDITTGARSDNASTLFRGHWRGSSVLKVRKKWQHALRQRQSFAERLQNFHSLHESEDFSLIILYQTTPTERVNWYRPSSDFHSKFRAEITFQGRAKLQGYSPHATNPVLTGREKESYSDCLDKLM
jgi:hypothetical protein